MDSALYSDDVREFGEFVRHGGSWSYGLKVARWVEPGAGQGERTDLGSIGPRSKVSATQFARDADVSRKSVDRYIKAWDYAADAGLVPHRERIQPGEDIAVEDLEDEQWTEAYRKGNKSKPTDEDSDGSELPEEMKLIQLKRKLIAQISGMTKAGQFTPEMVVQVCGEDDEMYKTIEYAVAGMAAWLNQINEERAGKAEVS